MAALIVGDKGQIIPYAKIKKWGIFLIFSLIASLIAICGIGFMMLNKQMEVAKLEDQIVDLEKKVSSIKNENDLLMAQLVIAKAQLPPPEKKEKAESGSDKKEPASVEPSPEKSSAKTETVKKDEAKNKSEIKKSEKKVQPSEDASSPSLSVKVEKVTASFDAKRNQINASYVVRNTSAGKVPVSGRGIIVLNPRGASSGEWISLPKVPLIQGKPDGKLGAAFKIANYKPFSLKTTGPSGAFAFDSGTVFIFDRKGKLLFEKEFPISLSYRPETKKPPAPVEEKKTPATPIAPKEEPAPAPSLKPQTEASLKAAENQSTTGAQNPPAPVPTGEEESKDQTQVDPNIDAMFQVQ